jgi:NADPH-dependent F420 reductase
MRIAIIGAGNVGGTLARAWARRGHEVVLGLRDPRSEESRRKAAAAGPSVRALAVREAAAAGEVVVLAVPWQAAEEAVRSAGDLTGKVLVDATNPLRADLSGLAIGHTTSAGERVQGWAPRAKVVKALNTIGARHMDGPEFAGGRPTMFLCGDDAAAKRTVAGLVEALGFDPVDCGPLAQARLLEPLAMLWISMAYAHGQGPDIAFRLLRK